MTRAGLGFDAHAFDPSRPLILGGVTIPDAPGLAGHSDADVLTHAVTDALLGSLALGDLGQHFPDSDPAWKDASSLDLLRRAVALVSERRFVVVSVDATVLIEEPKLAPFRDEMRRNLADALWASVDEVSVKASTTDTLGSVGRGEGAAAMAVVMCRPAT